MITSIVPQVLTNYYSHDAICTIDKHPRYTLLWAMTLRYPAVTPSELDEHFVKADIPWSLGDTQLYLDCPGNVPKVIWQTLIEEAEYLARLPYVNEECPKGEY